jgi:hypothetical protein
MTAAHLSNAAVLQLVASSIFLIRLVHWLVHRRQVRELCV